MVSNLRLWRLNGAPGRPLRCTCKAVSATEHVSGDVVDPSQRVGTTHQWNTSPVEVVTYLTLCTGSDVGTGTPESSFRILSAPDIENKLGMGRLCTFPEGGILAKSAGVLQAKALFAHCHTRIRCHILSPA